MGVMMEGLGMRMTCLGSGSAGNCYLFEASDGVLMVEAGIRFVEVKKALRFKISGIVGCLISHEHKDHSKSLKDVIGCGIRVLALEDVFQSQGIANRAFCKSIEPMHGYKVGGFKVFAFPVAHDVPCVGFVIEHEEMGKLLFVTDTMMLEYRVPKLNHVMLEANYADDILQYNIDNGIVPFAMRDRLLHSHMELETAKDVIRANDMAEVNEVILIHLSGNNSDSGRFKREICEVSGKPTHIATAGMSYDLSKTPF